jgi:transposase
MRHSPSWKILVHRCRRQQGGHSDGLHRKEAAMAWTRIQLTENEQLIVTEERTSHPNLQVRDKMWTIWLLHCGLTRQKAAEIVGVSRATVQRYVDAYRQGGLDGLRRSNVQRPVSELAAYRDIIRASFEQQPACTIAEACDRIEKLTGIRRSPTQVRKFLKGLGLKWQRIRAIPVPPKKTWTSTFGTKPSFSTPS